MAEGNLLDPPVQTNQDETRNGDRLPNLPGNPLQKLQVRRYCLNYLQQCTTLKRPPQSLRASGMNGLVTSKKLHTLSEAESKALEIAIKAKKEEIAQLELQIQQEPVQYTPLPRKLKNAWYKYYQQKITFYRSQESTKWNDWPTKKESMKQKSKSRKAKERKIKKEANEALQGGSVRNLTHEVVPPAVISLLAKGLGYVCTPEVDIPQLRLDGRRLTNKLINKAHFEENTVVPTEENTNQQNPITYDSDIPTKLQRPNYYQTKRRTTNVDTNVAVQVITDKLNSLPKTFKSKRLKNNLS